MLNRLIDKIAEMPRESLFLGTVTVLIGGLLVAMYQVCNTQVLHAQERERTVAVQRLAVYDCIDANPRASYRACVNEVAANFRARPAGNPSDSPSGYGGGEVMQAGFSRGGSAPANTMSAMTPVAYHRVLSR